MSDCIFCNLAQCHENIRFENAHVFVIDDINPQAPVHQLIIPKQHIATLNDLTEEHRWLVGELVYTAKQQAIYHSIDQTGFRTVFNCNKDGRQEVYHIHLHLLGGCLLT